MEEDKIIQVKENTLIISFNINIPIKFQDSVLNSIIIGLHNYINLKDDTQVPQKYINDILMKIQRQIDDLIILDDD